MTKRPSFRWPINVPKLMWSGFCASFTSHHNTLSYAYVVDRAPMLLPARSAGEELRFASGRMPWTLPGRWRNRRLVRGPGSTGRRHLVVELQDEVLRAIG